jgi:hypothetical protein
MVFHRTTVRISQNQFLQVMDADFQMPRDDIGQFTWLTSDGIWSLVSWRITARSRPRMPFLEFEWTHRLK